MCQCVSIVLLQIILCASMFTYMQDERLQDMGDKMRKMEEKMKQIEEFESVNFYDKLEAFNRIHLMEQKLDEFDRKLEAFNRIHLMVQKSDDRRISIEQEAAIELSLYDSEKHNKIPTFTAIVAVGSFLVWIFIGLFNGLFIVLNLFP